MRVETGDLPLMVDPQTRAVKTIAVTPEHLRELAFHDGRVPLSDRPVQSSIIPSASTAPVPWLCHLGFCGSTWLARLIDFGANRVLREPQILNDWASQAAAGVSRADVALPMIDEAFRAFANGAPLLIKPSNWANNLLPLSSPTRRLALLGLPRAEFIRAVARGGGERIGFVARLTVHLAHAAHGYDRAVADVLQAAAEDPNRLLRLAGIAHAMQLDLFRTASERSSALWLSTSRLQGQPRETVRALADWLGWPIDEAELRTVTDRWLNRHSKDGAPFTSPASREDAAIINAIEWSQHLEAEDWPADDWHPS